jgi:prepilin-type N-terminal cleavage/methylation domain-containing protein
MMRARHGQSKGFTIVELLIVVAIIAVMAAVSLPMLAGYFRLASVRRGASEVASEIQRARTKSIQKNANFGTVFCIVSTTQYQFFPEDVVNAGPGAVGPTQEGQVFMTRQGFAAADLYNQAGPLYSLPNGVQFVAQAAGGGRMVRFSRMGMACDPGAGSGTAACAPIAAVIDAPGGAGDFFKVVGTDRVVTVRDMNNGYELDVRVNPGGRVAVER